MGRHVGVLSAEQQEKQLIQERRSRWLPEAAATSPKQSSRGLATTLLLHLSVSKPNSGRTKPENTTMFTAGPKTLNPNLALQKNAQSGIKPYPLRRPKFLCQVPDHEPAYGALDNQSPKVPIHVSSGHAWHLTVFPHCPGSCAYASEERSACNSQQL